MTDGAPDTVHEVVVATGNDHKIEEMARTLTALLAPDIHLRKFSGRLPEETGSTFEENALLKARAAFKATGKPSIADDSGICVDALNGAPGIHSARYTPEGTDAANRRALIENLKGVKNREATFVCAIAFVTHDGETVVRGEWQGTVRAAAKGEGGFGYDPIFAPKGVTGTAAELTPTEKAAISHRARALGLIAPALNRYFDRTRA